MKSKRHLFSSVSALRGLPQVATLIISLCTAHFASAASQTWSGTTSSTWVTGTNWAGGSAPGVIYVSGNTVNNDLATFNSAIAANGNAANPIVVDLNRHVGGITFDTANAGAYVIGVTGGNPLKVTHNNSIQLTAAVAAAQTITAPIEIRLPSSTNGVFGINNNATSSAATLTFNGTVTGAAASSRPIALTLGGTNTGSNEMVNVITHGAGQQINLIKAGAGNWTLSGSNDFGANASGTNAGNTTINAGKLIVRHANALSYNTTLNGTAVNINSTGTLEIANGITLDDGLSLNLNNGGAIRSNGTNATNGRVNVALAAATSVTLEAVNSADVFTIGNAANDFTGGAADTVAHFTGAGTISLGLASNYLGKVSIDSAATLSLGNATALGASSSGIAFGAGSTGKLLLNGNSVTTGSLATDAATAGSPVINNNSLAAATLTLNGGSGSNTFAGVLQDGVLQDSSAAGAVSLVKSGAGSQTLAGANTYTGATTINGGTLSVTGSVASTAAVAVNSGATLAGNGSVAGAVTVAANASIAPGNGGVGTLTLGGLTLATDSKLVYDLNDLVTVNGDVTINGGVITLNAGAVISTNGVYNLIGYSGALNGDVTALGLYISNKDSSKAYTFGASGGFVTLTVADGNLPNYWNADSDSTWETGASWTTGMPNAAGAIAALGGGGTLITAPRTITMSGAYTVGTLTLNGAFSYTLADGGGASLTLDNAGAGAMVADSGGSHVIAVPLATTSYGVTFSTVVANDALTVTGAISGDGKLTKISSGGLVLSGVNTYLGGTQIDSGAVTINNAASLGDVAGVLTLNAATLHSTADIADARNINLGDTTSALVVDASTTLSLSGVIANGVAPGTLNKSGAGTLALSGVNTYSGGTVVNAGTLSLGSDAALGFAPTTPVTNLTLASGTTLQAAGAVNLNINRNVALSGGTVVIDSQANTMTLAGIVSGAGTLTKTGSGTLTLSNVGNTVGLIVREGTLRGGTTVANNGGFGTGAIELQGGTLSSAMAAGQTLYFANALTVAAGQTGSFNTTERTSWSGNVTGAGTLNVGVVTTASRFDLVNSFTGFTGQLNFTGSGTTRLLNNGGTFNTASFGSLSLDLGGSVYFSPTTNSTGNTYPIGALSGSSATATLGTGTAGRATFSIGSLGTSTTFAGAIAANTAITKVGSGTLTLTGVNSSTGVTTISAGGLQIGNGGAASFGTGAVINNGSLAFNTSSDVAQTTGISGTGSLTNAGTGKLTLSGINTYTGATSVNAGTLQLASETSLYNGVIASWTAANLKVASGATLVLNVGGVGEFTAANANTLLANLDGAVDNNGLQAGASLAFDTSNAAGGFALTGAVADSSGTGGGVIALRKLGANALTLSGSNSYSGGTTVAAGTLVAGSSNALGAGAVTVASGATLGSNSLLAVGDVTLADGASLALGSAASQISSTGAVNLAGPTVLTLGGATSTGIYTLLSGTSLTQNGVSVTGSGVGFETLAIGETKLVGHTTYELVATQTALVLTVTGDAYDLTWNGGDASWNSTDLNWQQGGTGPNMVFYNGDNTTLATASSIAIDAAGVFTGTLAVTNPTGSVILSGGTLSAGSLTKSGAGTLSVDNVMSITGAATVSGGTLTFGATGSLAGAASVNVSGSTLDISASNLSAASLSLTDGGTIMGSTGVLSGSAFDLQSGTVSAILGGNLSLHKTTGATATLSGANTFTGMTTISAGTLVFGADNNLGASAAVVSLNGGTLALNSLAAVTDTHVINLGSNGGTIDTGNQQFWLNSANLLTGSGPLTVNGPFGSLRLSFNNSFTGTTTINSGALVEVQNATGLGTSAITVNSGAELAVSNLGISNAVTANDGSTLSFDNGAGGNFGGAVLLSGGTTTLALRDWYNTAQANNGRISGVISGTGGLTINNGAGTGAVMTLSNTNTYSGGTVVNAGTLALGSSGAAGTGAITAANGTTISALVGVGGNNVNQAIILSGSNANVTLINANASGGFGSLITGSADQTLTISNAGTEPVNANSSSKQFQNFLGTVSIPVQQNLTFRATVLNNGGDNTLFDVNGYMGTRNNGNVALGALSGSGTVSMGTNGLATQLLTYTIGARVTDTTFSGVIRDGDTAGDKRVQVIKVGAATQVFSGVNTYTGNTTVNAGTLSLTNPYLADTADVRILASASAVLDLNYTGTDAIDQLFINGVEQYKGNWGRVGSGAQYESASITGDGILSVTNGPIPKIPATVTLDTASLTQTYTGSPVTVGSTTDQTVTSVTYTYTQNGVAAEPTLPGSYTVVATISDATYSGTATGTLVISKATATGTLDGLAATYDGSPKAVTVTTTPTGITATYSYNGSATAPTNAGSYPVTVSFEDATHIGTATGTLVIAKATSTVGSWPTAAGITYGQTLASATLTGGSSTPGGSFAFTAPTTAPNAGTASYSVTFTPTDAVNYETASSTASVTVAKAASTVSAWPTAAGITYGQTLASATLTGGSSTPGGTFAFTAPTTAPNAGTASQSVTFTPTDAVNYETASSTASVTVAKAASTVTTWPTAAAITYGQTLASATLTGGSSTPGGTFAFTAPTTAPNAGTASQSVTFTPTDAVNYLTASSTASVVTNKATPTVLSAPTASAINSGAALSTSVLSGGSASVGGVFTFTSPSTVPVATASQSVTFTPTDASNYNTASTSVSVTVNAAGYSAWASSNVSGAAANLDSDKDGVPNGVEYFMNAASGFTTHAGLNGSKVVSWTNGGNIASSAYGTQFAVQTSTDLVTWTDVASDNANLANTSGSVAYTVTGSGKRFVRLKVTPN